MHQGHFSQVRRRDEALHRLVDHIGDHAGGLTPATARPDDPPARWADHASGPPAPPRWAVGHGAAGDAGEVVERLTGVLGGAPEYVTLLGAPVGSHMGPRALVVGFFAEG